MDFCKTNEIMSILTETILTDLSDEGVGLKLSSKQGLLYFPKCGTKQGGRILKRFLDILKFEEQAVLDLDSVALIWRVLICIPCIR